VRALVTNDDGIGSVGLQVLARAAEAVGIDVTVAAPTWDSSGASASLTAVVEDGRFRVERTTLDGVGGACFAVEGAPAFIARAAMGGAFGEPPALVLSGVNRGLNAGHSILHSGTVGAVLTGAIYDRPGIAFSIDGADPEHWATAEHVIAEVLRWWTEEERAELILNVNVPDVDVHRLRGLREAPLAAFGAVTASVTSVEEGMVLMRYELPSGDPDAGSDASLVREGFATVTALEPLCAASTRVARSLEREHRT
jgi:5'-nucleotidase